MPPRNPPQLRPLAPTGALEDRAAAAALEEVARKLERAEARIEELERAAQRGGDSVSVEVPSLTRQGSKLMLSKRRLTFREQGLPQLSEALPEGEVQTGGGGGGDTITNNITQNIVNNNTIMDDAMILTGGFNVA